ncbi:unnamed protein product [Chrysoparadoxa australica]
MTKVFRRSSKTGKVSMFNLDKTLEAAKELGGSIRGSGHGRMGSSFMGSSDKVKLSDISASPSPGGYITAPSSASKHVEEAPVEVTTAKAEQPKWGAGFPRNSESNMLVGRFVLMKADISEAELVVVHGTLEGTIECKYLIIETGGMVTGTVKCEFADIAGRFDGKDLYVKTKLAVRTSGRVHASVSYSGLVVDSGGVLVGAMTYLGSKSKMSALAAAEADPTDVEVVEEEKHQSAEGE